MTYMLGIDTGGTYTDAVLLDGNRRVCGSAKALTTHDDLARGIGEALSDVLTRADRPVGLVSLSTTLATNALVEGHGSPVALLLVGQPPSFLERSGLGEALGGDPVEFIAGGHDASGGERDPLDLDAARAAIERHAPRVGAFAVSAYFSTRNPAHERQLQRLITDLTGRPVSSGHQLSAALDAPRRALTAVLNARLIPLLADLIQAVRSLLEQHGVTAPLMVVRGDGSLMSADFALGAPVETILSGPAASLIGARDLGGEENAVVLDIGGTTSDIGVLDGGEPRRNLDGAVVGGWRTRVRAVDVHTFGLGGDSSVRFDGNELPFSLGPTRVIPLSLLAHQYPGVGAILAEQAEERPLREHAGWFALRRRDPVAGTVGMSSVQRALWERLAEGPLDLVRLFEEQTRWRPLQRLIDRGVVALAGFTPSDAAHVSGAHDAWSTEAARMAAEIWSRIARERFGRELGDGSALAEAVLQSMAAHGARAVLAATLAGSEVAPGGRLHGPVRILIDRAVGSAPAHDLVETNLRLTRPLVVLGAPAKTYGAAIAERLGTRVVGSHEAGVANAVGAVAAGIVQRVVATITPLSGERYRVHTPGGVETLPTLDAARAWAAEATEQQARVRGEAAGADRLEVEIETDDVIGRTELGDELFFEGTVTATARGRPRALAPSPM